MVVSVANRWRLALCAWLLFPFGLVLPTGCAPPPPVLDDAWALQDKLHTQLVETLKQPWGRGDGFTYAVDTGHLLVYAALKKDKALYDQMRTFCVEKLVQNRPDDTYTQGFVLWRYKEGTPGDASGTTEALRVAEGLWLGHKAFGAQDDRDLALLILQGYARHAFVDQGIWLIRNYFNMQTRAFVTNSYLVDYDPDLLDKVALETKDKALEETATKSLTVVRQAMSPSGLLYAVIQPEVATLLPKSLAFFSPNDTIKLFNTVTVAERVIDTAPDIGRRVLAFAMERLDDLHQYYLGKTGERALDAPVGAITYAGLMRLAARLERSQDVEALLEPFLFHAKVFLENPYAPKLYTAGELLLTLQYMRLIYKDK